MKILITGGAGFVASHLAPRLLQDSAHELILLDNFNDYYSPELKRAHARLLQGQVRALWEEGDFTDTAYCMQLFERHRPSHVIHLGAYPGVPYSLQAPELYIRNNISGTTALLEAARRFSVERFLFASSSTVYGVGSHVPFVEDLPLGVPASPYGVTKRAGELMGLSYHRLFSIPFTSLRLFNVYGPRIRPDLALAIFTRKIMTGEPLPLYGDGSIRRDFTHASDICSGIVRALTAEGIAGECINLGHNEPIEVRRLIELIESGVGKPAVIERLPAREGDMPITCADLGKARRLLQYEPQVSIEDGIQEYVRWARQSS